MLSSPTQVISFWPAFQAPNTNRNEKSNGNTPRIIRYSSAGSRKMYLALWSRERRDPAVEGAGTVIAGCAVVIGLLELDARPLVSFRPASRSRRRALGGHAKMRAIGGNLAVATE